MRVDLYNCQWNDAAIDLPFHQAGADSVFSAKTDHGFSCKDMRDYSTGNLRNDIPGFTWQREGRQRVNAEISDNLTVRFPVV